MTIDDTTPSPATGTQTQSNSPSAGARRSLVRRLGRWLAHRMPKGLYGRSLIIIIAPMVLLQSVVAFVFMERHWQTVTQRLSKAVTADIAAIIEIIDTFPQDPDYRKITEIAAEKLQLNISVIDAEPFPPVTRKPFISILDDTLHEEITNQIGRPFWLDTVGNSRLLEIRILLEKQNKNLRVFVHRSQAYASNSHIFLVWMVGTSAVLLLIAILFLRNQIRPIQRLANAAEAFGKGREAPNDLQLRGSREVRQASLAFLQMRDRIERQIEQRTDMLTGVSHDLRTVLTRFKLELAMVPKSAETAAMEQDVNEMQTMLQGYLDFARGESSEQFGDVKVCNTLEDFVRQADRAGKSVSLNCDRDIVVRARPNAFARLCGNIISNAIRYADDISVKVIRGVSWLSIVVDDDGPGVPQEQREAVFKPFYRLDKARNLDKSGTGLGLSIARDIARNHGGDIYLHDSPKGGLRAIIKMPM